MGWLAGRIQIVKFLIPQPTLYLLLLSHYIPVTPKSRCFSTCCNIVPLHYKIIASHDDWTLHLFAINPSSPSNHDSLSWKQDSISIVSLKRTNHMYSKTLRVTVFRFVTKPCLTYRFCCILFLSQCEVWLIHLCLGFPLSLHLSWKCVTCSYNPTPQFCISQCL